MSHDTKTLPFEAVYSAAENAFSEALDWHKPEGATPETIHRESRACRVASFALFDELRNGGFPVRQESRSGLIVDEHRYVVFDRDDIEIVVDPTWQQFLPKEVDSTKMPRVLIGPREEVIDYARKAGVNEANLQLWAPKGMYEEPDNRTVQEKIAAAIDSIN